MKNNSVLIFFMFLCFLIGPFAYSAEKEMYVYNEGFIYNYGGYMSSDYNYSHLYISEHYEDSTVSDGHLSCEIEFSGLPSYGWWGGFWVQNEDQNWTGNGLDFSDCSSFKFWIRGAKGANVTAIYILFNGNYDAIPGFSLSSTWTEYTIDLSSLDVTNVNNIFGIAILTDGGPDSNVTIYLDKARFVTDRTDDTPKIVQVSGNVFDQSCAMTVNGATYNIKGVGYAGDGIGAPDYDIDFQKISDMGANTIRIWGHNQINFAMLDKLSDYGLNTIMSYWLPRLPGTDFYSSPIYAAARQGIKDDLLQWINTYKDHPAILMWVLGNEVYWSIQDSSPTEQEAFSVFLNELCQIVHSADPNHPVGYAVVNPLYPFNSRRCPSLYYDSIWDLSGLASTLNSTKTHYLYTHLSSDSVDLLNSYIGGDTSVSSDLQKGLVSDFNKFVYDEGYRNLFGALHAYYAGLSTPIDLDAVILSSDTISYINSTGLYDSAGNLTKSPSALSEDEIYEVEWVNRYILQDIYSGDIEQRSYNHEFVNGGFLQYIREDNLPDLDVICLNMYDCLTPSYFPSEYLTYNYNRPVIITEFNEAPWESAYGSDQDLFNDTSYDSQKATTLVNRWHATTNSVGVALGGCAFSWLDVVGEHGEGTYRFGLVDSDATRTDRAQYVALQNEWTSANNSPVLSTIGSQAVREGSELTFMINATDADGDTIVCSASGLPAGASFTGQTFTWTPGSSSSGTYNVIFTARDFYSSVSETVTINVARINSPQVETIVPSSGSSYSNTPLSFTATYSDPDGYTDLKYTYIIINSRLSGSNCFYAYYDRSLNKLYLRDNGNTVWTGGYEPGSANTISNSYCTLNCANTSVTQIGSTVTIQWAVTFDPNMIGTKNSYLYVYDNKGAIDGWDILGAVSIVA